MDTVWNVEMGDRGRLVVPGRIRKEFGWDAGTKLVAVRTQSGVMLVSPDTAHELIASQLAGHDVVADLLDERRTQAAIEGAA